MHNQTIEASPSSIDVTDEMRPEYDFSQGIRGKHAKEMQAGYTMTIHHADGSVTVKKVNPPKSLIVLDPDVLAYFPDSHSVNEALRGLINLVPKAVTPRTRKRKTIHPS